MRWDLGFGFGIFMISGVEDPKIPNELCCMKNVPNPTHIKEAKVCRIKC